MANPSELCVWCRNLTGKEETTACRMGKNPFRWVITCTTYTPK